jgi:3-methyl-2-oxobutanoate hydroxymethyltransferase
MSSTSSPQVASRAPITVPAVRNRKVRNGDEPLVMVTAYDAPSARVADEAGVDMILVGDSVAMVVLGYDDTLQVTVDDLAHIRAGGECVKLEGGRKRVPMIEALIDAEIPVMGHIGLTPQSVHAMGGFKVQGKETDAAMALVSDAKALAHAGCFAIVLEGVPTEVASLVTAAEDVPIIGIGAGDDCDGQVLVYHDVLGIEDRIAPKFVRRYADVKAASVAGVAAYAADVRGGQFPSAAESYHLSAEAAETLGLYGRPT